MTEEQNKGLAELAEKALEQWACAIESLQHAPESYDCDSAWRQHHEMRREIAALRDREPATDAVPDAWLVNYYEEWTDGRKLNVTQASLEPHEPAIRLDKEPEIERRVLKSAIPLYRSLKGKGASQDEDAK